MIKPMENLPENILGFEFSGKVSAKEYENIIFPAIDKYSKQQSKLKLICHFTDKTLIDLGAMWDDTLAGLKHYFKWAKIAVLPDIAWLNHTIKAMGFLLPEYLRTYSNDELQKAKDWLKEK
jgi:hypothetical protein